MGVDAATRCEGTGEEDRARLRPWQDRLLAAQLDLGQAAARAITAGQLDGCGYRRWLRAERALAGEVLQALRPIQQTCGGPSPLAQWLDEQADVWKAALAALDSDLDALAGNADCDERPDHVEHRLWAAGRLVGKQEVLGATALLDAVLGGPARDAIDALLALPHVTPANAHYLLHRRQQLETGLPWRRRVLERLPLDASAWQALDRGADHAARAYRTLCAQVWAPAEE